MNMQPARTCLYNCNPFDYDLSEEEIHETPTDKALRMVQEELDSATDKKRTILLLVELEVTKLMMLCPSINYVLINLLILLTIPSINIYLHRRNSTFQELAVCDILMSPSVLVRISGSILRTGTKQSLIL